ncbi:MAG: MotA/TolQ/ExbB proton channel family protein [Planctomycetota bacterium]|nr:MotA/TolQ/ExbB proton channel family protein [Planctomycetota bacterium]
MDLGTIIGLFAAFGLLMWSLYSGSGGDIFGTFLDPAAFVMVVCGSTFIVLLSCRVDRFLAMAKITMNAFFNRGRPPEVLIQELVKLADVARREGILSLQNTISEMKDTFLQNGLQMVVDGTEGDTVKQVLEFELEAIEKRHEEGKGVLDLFGKYAPAFGMIGTLVGLVVMLKNMDDPSKIGPGMAIALLTTMYGAVMANVICLPLADKLNAKHDEEMLSLEIAKAGIMGLQAGDNPRVLEMKLAVFLSPKQRTKLAAATAA